MPPANPQTITGVSSILREILLPKVRSQLNNSVLFLQMFQRETKTIRQVGRDLKALMSFRTRHNQSIGNRASGSQLPAHGRAYYDQLEVQLGRVYGQISFDRIILSRPLKGNASVVADILDEEMNSLVRTFRVDMSRQVQLDGSGAMCRITSAGATGDSFVVDDARYLEPGMKIDSYAAKTGGSANIDSATISDVDHMTNTVTLEASATWVQNDYVFREDNRGLEANGLLAIVDDGTVVSTIQGVDRTSTSLMNAVLIDAQTDPLSEDLIQYGCDWADRISGEMIDFIGSDHDSRRYWSTLKAVERRQVNTFKLKGGFTGLGFYAGGREVPWFTDRHFWPGYIYGLKKMHFCFFEAGPPKWFDEDGAVLNRIPDYDEMEATMCHYWQLGFDRVNGCFRISNFTNPNGTPAWA